MEILRYWKDWPPEHVVGRLFAQAWKILGEPGEAKQAPKVATQEEMQRFGQALFGGARG